MKRSGMTNTIRRLVRRWKMWQRKRDIIRTCGCIAFCPHCRDPLNDQAHWLDPNNEGHGRYLCRACGGESEWHFGIAPGPVCITPNRGNI